MLFIVVGHVGGRSELEPFHSSVTIAPHAVNCFVLISGYFLITSKFKFARVLRTVLETIFYVFAITVILYAFGKASIADVAKSIMPFAPTKFTYWFVNKYIAVILLSPFICKLCNNITKTQYRILVASLLLISSTLFAFFPFGQLFGNGFSLLWMITVFITGGYLKLHAPKFKYWGIATMLLLILYNLCNLYLSGTIELHYNSLVTYSLSIATFMWFKGLNVSNSGILAKYTHFIAPHVFAAYLIHEQGLMRVYIVDLLNGFQGYMPDMLYLYLFGIIVIIISALIDKVRLLLFKYCGIDYIANKISAKADKLYAE